MKSDKNLQKEPKFKGNFPRLAKEKSIFMERKLPIRKVEFHGPRHRG